MNTYSRAPTKEVGTVGFVLGGRMITTSAAKLLNDHIFAKNPIFYP